MRKKSWHIDRRRFLRGAGVSLGLPLLDGMTWAKSEEITIPKRMCVFYFPFGVTLAGEWGWFPTEQGIDFTFPKVLEPLEPMRNDLTVINGLSHPKAHSMPGHDTADIMLTGAAFKAPDFKNTVSLDQVIAKHFQPHTRFPSLVMSSEGGIGDPTRSCTLSYTSEGRPIPAMSDPEKIFQRLFGLVTDKEREEIKKSGNLLDRVLQDARDLNRQLGKHDQEKFAEYLDSVRSVEIEVERAGDWLHVPKPNVDGHGINLEVTPSQADDYVNSMYDLIHLALKTDSTRVSTYQLGQNLGAAYSATVFSRALGLPNWHGVGHAAEKKPEDMAKMQFWLSKGLHRFLSRMKETAEGEGNLLDRTMVLYGSTNDSTHGTKNYPLILAGGKELGIRHSGSLKFDGGQKLSNLFLTMLRRLDVPCESFADSSGELPQVLVS